MAYRDRDKEKAMYKAQRDKYRARRNAYSKAWRERHKAAVSAYNQKYYAAHFASKTDETKRELRDAFNAAVETRRQNAPIKRDASLARSESYMKEYYKKQREENADALRVQWRRASSAYSKAHPLRVNEHAARRRARMRQTAVEPVDFEKILRDAKGRCAICKKPFDLFGVHFDHKVPLSRGGTHTTANIQATHARCNLTKWAKVV